MALSVPLSRSTLRVGGGSAFFVRPLERMKTRTTIIIVGVALVIGAAIGFGISSYFWSRLSESQTIASSLSGVSTAYAPLKLLKDGRSKDATDILEVELDSSMRNLELMSDTLHRPDILTNSFVVGAKALK